MSEQKPKTFTFINNQKLCDIIESAATRIVYIAPSLAKSVAEAILQFKRNNAVADLRVIIDTDAETFRLGFGEEAGLKLLAVNQIENVRRAPNLRIGVLIADNNAWIYSPTPEIIFEQPTAAVNNAIQVGIAFAEQILQSVAPDICHKSALDTLNRENVIENRAPEIETEEFTAEDMNRIKQELRENPPRQFDAARRVQVYQSHFQFVEMSLKGCRLDSRTIHLPSELLNIVNESTLGDRLKIKSTYRLIDGKSNFFAEIKIIEEKVKKLREEFLKSLGERYGSIILRKRRAEFDCKVSAIEKELSNLRDTVKDKLQNEIEKSRENLINKLLPVVLPNLSAEIKSHLFHQTDEEIAREFISARIDRQIPEIQEMISEINLICDYKDVTFEMLNDAEFINLIEHKFPERQFPSLYAEEETLGGKWK